MGNKLAIRCGRLIDGITHSPHRNMTILIEESEIVEVQERLTTPQGATVIDATDKTVIPGLIDGHVHLNSDPGIDQIQNLLAPDSAVNLRAAKNARITLEAGFTSILGNCGYKNYADLFLKEAIDDGWIPGPRLWTSGPMVTSTLRKGVWLKYGIPLQPFEAADGVDEMRRLVRRHIASGVNWIKVLATYDIGSIAGEPTRGNLNEEEMKVVVAEAHTQRKKVKVHLEGSDTTKYALAAGIDIVLHGFFLDDDDVEVMNKRRIPLIPTLAWMGEIAKTNAPGQPLWYSQKAQRYRAIHLASFKRARDAGVIIAAGTDCSGGGSAGDFLRHGQNSKELEYLVANGLTPVEAIIAGTRNVAEAFGLSQFIGTVEQGKLADLIVVNGDPSKDITILQDKRNIETVIKHGTIVVERGTSKACKCPALELISGGASSSTAN